MVKYFDEEWPKEEAILKQGLDWSRQSKRERMKKVFCIGNGGSRKDFNLETDHIFFFGDKMNTNGNDKPLADVNKQGENFHVTDWQHTWNLLKEFK